MKKGWILALALVALMTLLYGAAAEEAVFQPEDLPVVYLHIDGGQAEIDKLNGSDDHSYRCTGTMDIAVPAGYSGGFDGRYPQENVKGLKIKYIRGRGNGTWDMDKNPYKIKLEDKADLFGMGQGKTWILLANYFDESLLRNWLVQWVGNRTGLEYTPQGVFVELVMDGEYLGNYYLCEHVQIAKARLAIDELKEENTELPEIQGGYLLMFSPDESEGPDAFETSHGLLLGTKDPSFDPENGGYVNDAQKKYIRDYVQKAEGGIYGEAGNYADYLDLKSMADYWWIMEFIINEDAFGTDSQHMFKPRYEADGSEGKLHFGPLWDFDACLGNGQKETALEPGFNNTTFIWMDEMRKKPEFREVLKERWQVLDGALEELVQDGGALDRTAAIIRNSWYRDEAKWHSFKEERDMLPNRNFEEEMTHIKTWINLRREWVAQHLDDLDVLTFNATFRGEGVTEVTHQVAAWSNIDVYMYYETDPEVEGKTFKGWALEDGTLVESVIADHDVVLTAQYE